MSDLLLVLLILCFGIYGMLVMLITGVYLVRDWDTILSYTPKDLRLITEMNWFGCIVSWMGLVLLNPVYWIVVELPAVIIKYVGKFFYFIFHVSGRKKNEE